MVWAYPGGTQIFRAVQTTDGWTADYDTCQIIDVVRCYVTPSRPHSSLEDAHSATKTALTLMAATSCNAWQAVATRELLLLLLQPTMRGAH